MAYLAFKQQLLTRNYFFFRHSKEVMWYLVKWCDLPYDQSTWEREDAEIVEIKKYIDQYEVLR